MLINQKGQSTVELALASMALLILVQALLVVAYFSSFRIYMDYRSHEALLCAAQKTTPMVCKSALQKELMQFLVFGKLQKLEIYKNNQRAWLRLQIHFSFLPKGQTWRHQEQIRLPLSS